LASAPVTYYRFEESSEIILDSANSPVPPQSNAQNGINDGATLGVPGPWPGDILGGEPIGAVGFDPRNLAADFDGFGFLGDRFTAASSQFNQLDEGPYSFELFFKSDSTGAGLHQNVISKGTCCDRNSWFLLYAGTSGGPLTQGHLRFGIDDGGNGEFVDSTISLAPNEWSHLAGTYDPITGEARLYVNGQLEVSGTLTGSPTPSDGAPLAVSHW